MTLVYGSVCSGIEAATVAWQPLGWRPAFFAEIEKFPSAVLARHYGSNMPGETLSRNGVPNHGDFTEIGADAGPVDILVGGTPCQSFSVAGKRLGLDDPRGNLALEYLRLARRLRARWIVWENVPGVLSSYSGGPDHGGEPRPGDEWREDHDFATFLEFVRECGYGFAYRVLDTQFVRVSGYARAIPQRRRRVILVGHIGDWRRAAAVLFDPGSMLGHPPPRREAGQGVAGTLGGSSQSGGFRTTDLDSVGAFVAERDVVGTVSSKWSKGAGAPAGDECQNIIAFHGSQDPDISGDVAHPVGRNQGQETRVAIQERAISANPSAGPDGKGWRDDSAAYTLEARSVPQSVAHTLKAEGHDASEDGTGRGIPLVPVAFQTRFARNDRDGPSDVAYPLTAEAGTTGKGDSAQSVLMPVAFDRAQITSPHNGSQPTDVSPAMAKTSDLHMASSWTVRRLTVTECERLQGQEDGYTAVLNWDGWRDVGADEDIEDLREAGFRLRRSKRGWRVNDPDGPRYKALGNSMSVNVMRHVGERIDLFERLVAEGRIPPHDAEGAA